MKIFGILGGLLVLVIVGAFAFIAFTDVNVPQTTVTKEISTENLAQ